MNTFRIILSVFIAVQMWVYILYGIIEGDKPAQKKGWAVVVATYAFCLVGIWAR